MNALTSMTGYASGEIKVANKTYRVQIKSVNHRFFECRVKSPRELFFAELPIKTKLKSTLRRGYVDVQIEEEKDATNEKTVETFVNTLLALDAQLPNRVHNQMSLHERFSLLLKNSDLWKSDRGNEVELSHFAELLEPLVIKLDEDRKREGEQLKHQLQEILSNLQLYLGIVRESLPKISSEWHQQITDKLQSLFKDRSLDLPQERIAQELLLLAEKRDVAEEIARTQSHLSHLEEILNTPPLDAGKKLDFLCQELHREWTTLSNKIQNIPLSKVTLDAKLEVEKLREQAQNFV